MTQSSISLSRLNNALSNLLSTVVVEYNGKNCI